MPPSCWKIQPLERLFHQRLSSSFGPHIPTRLSGSSSPTPSIFHPMLPLFPSTFLTSQPQQLHLPRPCGEVTPADTPTATGWPESKTQQGPAELPRSLWLQRRGENENPHPKLASPPAKGGFPQAAAPPSPLSLTDAAQRSQHCQASSCPPQSCLPSEKRQQGPADIL